MLIMLLTVSSAAKYAGRSGRVARAMPSKSNAALSRTLLSNLSNMGHLDRVMALISMIERPGWVRCPVAQYDTMPYMELAHNANAFMTRASE